MQLSEVKRLGRTSLQAISVLALHWAMKFRGIVFTKHPYLTMSVLLLLLVLSPDVRFRIFAQFIVLSVLI